MNNTPNRSHPYDDADRGSPVNMLWGLILISLTFLLIVVCILAAGNFLDDIEENKLPDDPIDPGTPSTPDTPDTPDTPTQPDNPPNYQGDSQGQTPDTSDDTPGDDDVLKPAEPGTSLPTSYIIHKTADTVTLDTDPLIKSNLYSRYAVLVDVENREIIAGKNFDSPMSPSSLAQTMTLLVACEHLTEDDLKKPIMISADIVDRLKTSSVSDSDLVPGEEFTVESLLYAVALTSNEVAAEQLAVYVAGSTDDFVAMMNKKAEELGLINTNFVNCTGRYHADQTSTCRELASIMIAAMDNDLVKTLLSAQSYSIATNVHPEGRTFNSEYYTIVEAMRGIGWTTQPAGGSIIATKTGFSAESNYCLASYYERSYDQKPYVVISANVPAAYYWSVYDYIKLYEDYAK